MEPNTKAVSRSPRKILISVLKNFMSGYAGQKSVEMEITGNERLPFALKGFLVWLFSMISGLSGETCGLVHGIGGNPPLNSHSHVPLY